MNKCDEEIYAQLILSKYISQSVDKQRKKDRKNPLQTSSLLQTSIPLTNCKVMAFRNTLKFNSTSRNLHYRFNLVALVLVSATLLE